jgi:SAM-dependent methyltransferase
MEERLGLGRKILGRFAWYRDYSAARSIQRQIRRARRYSFECPNCGYHGPFAHAGSPIRLHSVCMRCTSRERHRLVKLWLDRNAETVLGKSVLHFAPEQAMRPIIERLAATYLTADIEPGRADKVLNIERIDELSETYDFIVCSHVLEHVDDARALREMHRILRPGGTALLMTPVVEGWDETYENPAIESERDRTLHFGQEDHVRYYGADIRERIRNAGFSLREFSSSGAECARYALMPGERIFLAERPADS